MVVVYVSYIRCKPGCLILTNVYFQIVLTVEATQVGTHVTSHYQSIQTSFKLNQRQRSTSTRPFVSLDPLNHGSSHQHTLCFPNLVGRFVYVAHLIYTVSLLRLYYYLSFFLSSYWSYNPIVRGLLLLVNVLQDGELQKMKTSLNGTKKSLGEQEVSEWQLHTSNTNPAQKICSTVRSRTQAEMVTQVQQVYPLTIGTAIKKIIFSSVCILTIITTVFS